MITEVNRTAVERSASLTSLKSHLDALRDSFGGAGSAEVTPFPKKIRDLSKRFSVHFGASANTSFSMEYHGMGTRSWASMLAVKAFSDLQAQKHLDEARAFHPILAAEEPEAHLHPNAQRALYKQLSQSAGQVLISTHSPYLAAMCDLDSLRGVSASGGRRQGRQLVQGLGPEEKGVLHREVMRTRGEFLFAKAAIIFEGVTEEQIFPSIFEKYFGQPAFAMGVAFVGVGGKNYAPFIKLGASFGVPVFVVSDNDAGAQASVTAHINRIQQDTGLVLDPTNFGLSFLTAGNDVEAELIHIQGLRPEVIEALVDTETRGTDNLAWRAAKLTELNALGDNDLVDRMRSAKTSYSANLANAVTRNSRNLTGVQLAPPALRQAFQAVHQWLT
jgi:putative ATP-dependent endonuclease of OLD family